MDLAKILLPSIYLNNFPHQKKHIYIFINGNPCLYVSEINNSKYIHMLINKIKIKTWTLANFLPWNARSARYSLTSVLIGTIDIYLCGKLSDSMVMGSSVKHSIKTEVAYYQKMLIGC